MPHSESSTVLAPTEPAEPSTAWAALAGKLEGELHRGNALRRLYSTDASEYQELPAAVVLPKSEADLRHLLAFARQHRLGLIARGAGTSLAGQVVGNGIVVDVGRHLNAILGFDAARRRVRVQPGVVRNELNRFLAPHGFLFGPETSTANRAMIGGMVGNNSCGSNSIVYGSVRDHLISTRGFLSDGSEVTFGPLNAAEFAAKINEAHSVENIRNVLKECGQHQMDVFSRESRNFLRRNQRLVEATTQLLASARKH